MKKATIILALVAATLTGCTTSKQATTDEQRNYISWIAFCANRGYNINDNTFPAVNEDLDTWVEEEKAFISAGVEPY